MFKLSIPSNFDNVVNFHLNTFWESTGKLNFFVLNCPDNFVRFTIQYSPAYVDDGGKRKVQFRALLTNL